MEDLHRILEVVQSASPSGVLATIVHVDGSAYKKEGACMLIKEDGSTIGTLSAGCLEEDLIARLKNAPNQVRQLIEYDMRGTDLISWGEGAGCNGVLQILVEPIDVRFHYHLCELKLALDNGKIVLIAKKTDVPGKGMQYIFVTEDHDSFGNWHGQIPEEIRSWIGQPKGMVKCGKRQGSNGNGDYFIQTIKPQPRLIVFGAGPDAIPLVSLTSNIGFKVTVVDWRPALCTKDRFPDADLVIGFPDEVVEKLAIQKNDFIILLTHNFQKDKQLISHLISRELTYLGVLGSEDRTSRLLETNEFPPYLSTPAGLSIDAKGPEEIAVSISAELIQVYRSQGVKEGIEI